MSVTWQPMVAVVGVAVLAGAIAWALWEQAAAKTPPVPGYKGQAFVELAATMPPISEFDTFNVNELNPFVSWREREAEAKRIKEGKIVPVVRFSKPAEIKPVDPPKYAPPRRSEGGGDAPRIIGIYGKKSAPAGVVVQLPKSGQHRTLAIGETAEDWTLTGIELGSICTFTDKAGRSYTFVIGSDAPAPIPASGAGTGGSASTEPPKADPLPPAAEPTPVKKQPFSPRGPRPQKK